MFYVMLVYFMWDEYIVSLCHCVSDSDTILMAIKGVYFLL